ncbi:NTP transferase domain-containing protein [Allosphingosinicella sp.]|jgi:GTP:adenosylcobinamide-phosphate guanylyltransferase|uniref:NTP transferase domain-containing protein n=1 Tax=Allosphingosinicella sp. TaxID=2823234 RepID=UPI002F1C6C2C
MASSERGFAAIVLAAQRGGRLDPLADKAGVTHKCLVPICGKPLLEHVLRALVAVPGLSRIHISIEKDAVDAVRGVRGASGDLGVPVDYVPAATNIADSVYAAAHRVDEPILITTADNVLLSSAIAEQLVERLHSGAECVLVVATREAVLEAHPDGQRRFYKLADASYSNCNLYGLRGQRALRAAETFRSGGQFAKNPKRLAETFGLFNLLLVRFGLISLQRAMARMSRHFGVRAEAVVAEDGSQAIDVDNVRTYDVARTILERRARS